MSSLAPPGGIQEPGCIRPVETVAPQAGLLRPKKREAHDRAVVTDVSVPSDLMLPALAAELVQTLAPILSGMLRDCLSRIAE